MSSERGQQTRIATHSSENPIFGLMTNPFFLLFSLSSSNRKKRRRKTFYLLILSASLEYDGAEGRLVKKSIAASFIGNSEESYALLFMKMNSPKMRGIIDIIFMFISRSSGKFLLRVALGTSLRMTASAYGAINVTCL